jgi:haloalkane dehalogenase
MKVLRTPETSFASIKDYPFEPHYTDVETDDGTTIRIHHIDEGPSDGPVVLCLHGQPVWSYLFRKMIPYLTGAGLRVICPDLVGFGKSDKPAAREDYSYERQVKWMGAWLEQNDFTALTLFGQDWGGLIGLRLVAAHSPRFDRVVISNTGLPYNPNVPQEQVAEVEAYRASAPTPTMFDMAKEMGRLSWDTKAVNPARVFAVWQKFCWETEYLPIGFMLSFSTEPQTKILQIARALLHKLGFRSPLPSAVAKAYDAPFPSAEFTMGPRAMPSQVPSLPTSPSLEPQRLAWEFFDAFEKPFLCAFTDDDPITKGSDKEFRERVPGAKNESHPTLRGGGHFVQETRPKEISEVIIDFVARSQTTAQH